jgi:hypothetical protein
LKRRKNPRKAKRKSLLVASVEIAMTSPRNPRNVVVVVKAEGKVVVNEESPVNLRERKIVRAVIQMSAGAKIVGHVLRKLIQRKRTKKMSRFVVTSHVEKIGACARMRFAVKIGACARMIGKYARITFVEMIEECGQMVPVETIGECGRMTFGEMIEECGRMMFDETTGACGQMVLVEMIVGECGRMMLVEKKEG